MCNRERMSNEDFILVCSKIDEHKDYFNSISQDLWNNPELNYKEKYAHELLSGALEKFGFEVKRHYLLDTAFRAEYSSGAGPTVAILLEYDALPVIGHACGHNLISETGLAAGMAVKAAMEADSSIMGKIIVLGTPAEENGGGKIKLLNQGAFTDIDVAMMAHPRRFTCYAPPALSILQLMVEFQGREAHAAAFPWEGRNALDAAVAAYQNIALLRQHIKPTSRIHGIITRGGTVPNIIPGESRLEIYVRASNKVELMTLLDKVKECIIGAARATGCESTINYDESTAYENLLSNKVMVSVFESFAKKLDLPPTDFASSPIPAGSTDMGNISHAVPSIHPMFNIHTNAANHTREFAEAARSPLAQTPTLQTAKALALTTLSLLRQPDLLKGIQEQFQVDIDAGL